MMVKPPVADWRERYADKLMPPREAMGAVRPGDAVRMGGLNSVPATLCGGLAERASELPGVRVYTFLTPFDWDRPEILEHVRDVTGNVCSESWGARALSGPGGQPAFAYAAPVTNATSIIVLPSSQLVGGVRHSRIMATLPEGSTITTHRADVDYVVTEQGVAHLSGKSVRARAAELAGVAHPDLRSERRDQVRKIHNVSV